MRRANTGIRWSNKVPPLVVNIGQSSAVVGGAIAISVPAGGVPYKADIFIIGCDNGSTGGGAGSDTTGNSYTTSVNSIGGAIELIFLRARQVAALVAGNTVTYTLAAGATVASACAFWVSGLTDVVNDAATIGNATGTSATPSVTSGVPAQSGEFFIGAVASASSVASFVQDSAHGLWAPPPVPLLGAPLLGCGSIINSGGAAQIYAPTLGGSVAWLAGIAGFKAGY